LNGNPEGQRMKNLSLMSSVVQLIFVIFSLIAVLALPSSPGYNDYFGNVDIDKSQTGLQFGFCLAVSSLGIVETLLSIASVVRAHRGSLLAMVAFNVMFGILNFISFILWALLTVTFGAFGVGLAFSVICIFAYFSTGLFISSWLLLPTTPEAAAQEQRELNMEEPKN